MTSLTGRWLSSAAVTLCLPALWLSSKTRRRFWVRLGHLPPFSVKAEPKLRVWWHGASLGDVRALHPVIRAVREARPHQAWLTTLTDSGLEYAEHHLSSDLNVLPAPFDAPAFVVPYINRIRPHVLVLERLELWPQLISFAHESGAKIIITNGSVRSDKVKIHRSVLRFFGSIQRKIDLALARTEEDAAQLESLGIVPDRIEVMGDSKIDGLLTDSLAPHEVRRWVKSKTVWLAASIHADEEREILATHVRIKNMFSNVRCIVAPRYLSRVSAIAERARRYGLVAVRRTDINRLMSNPQLSDKWDVLILDSFGELSACYGLAEVAVIGGTFGSREGQNPYEAAAAGCPSIIGPRTGAFASASWALIQQGAALRAEDWSDVGMFLVDCLGSPNRCQKMGQEGRIWIESQRGAAERASEAIARVVDSIG